MMGVRLVKDVENMKPRKLAIEEHQKTRKLWEEIFPEDSSEFLDYYYSEIASNNEIYVIEEHDRIVSMIHLNPYEMRIGDRRYQTHYIVAVATIEQCRGKGLMRQLMNYVLQIMTERNEPFTFLMPASEAIYKPFGFAYVYEQKVEKVYGKRCTDEELEVVSANENDCWEIADFANEYLQQYNVATWRDAKYYQRMIAELKSEKGEILLTKRRGKITGVFCYTNTDVVEIREPIFCDKADLQYVIFRLTGNEKQSVFCYGCGSGEAKPTIMAKVLQPELSVDLQKAKVFLNEIV